MSGKRESQMIHKFNTHLKIYILHAYKFIKICIKSLLKFVSLQFGSNLITSNSNVHCNSYKNRKHSIFNEDQ